MQESDDEKRLSSCLKKIIKYFESETIILLDRVLADDEDNAEYSAVTCWKNLETLLEVKELYCKEPHMVISDYLLMLQYTEEEISILKKRKQNEELARKQWPKATNLTSGNGTD